ncbi:MAG: tRNA uridine-5-carboxymethylaminomethyl(34) synthesis GTPase MnmE [Coxiella sp. RIFCSPHIGHO2_12_FULL_44_14]|nr:MAG: tRNA uridine-5-carboxymethylaminomethyl(34) synthesis GTPase MnmE [Coxiella sp. RIFCSPHIGHO2_12_FULL_44_14]
MKSNSETIAALATPPGKGGIGVIRISGPLVRHMAQQILGFLPEPRLATFCQFKRSQHRLDEGLALFFPEPHSFTGEDVLELQGHGGPVVLDQLLKAVLQEGARVARPGEFSERAFLNNKMDLTQAEAIADLINADSVQAARSALRSLQGEFSQKINALQQTLIELRKFVEAAIDFPEEEIDFIAESDVEQRLSDLIEKVKAVLATAKQGALLQEGMTVVIAGEPNAGKSSLLNCLSGKESAIVTDVAGTTRDVLREHIHIDGMPLHIIDTAGLRETADVVEQEGVRRARQAIQQADLVLLVIDGSKNEDANREIQRIYQQMQLPESLPMAIVVNKIDLIGEPATTTQLDDISVIKISAKWQTGIAELRAFLREFMGFNREQEGVFIARRRHLDALSRTEALLTQGFLQLKQHRAAELLAEDLRQAQLKMSEITGEFSSDDLLGEIFSSFCIGK